jgi:hypothetical protein
VQQVVGYLRHTGRNGNLYEEAALNIGSLRCCNLSGGCWFSLWDWLQNKMTCLMQSANQPDA